MRTYYTHWEFMWATEKGTGQSCVVYLERATRKSGTFKCNESVRYFDYQGD